MGQKSSQLVRVEGSVSPGFESVKEMFEKNFRRGAEDSAQLCVYVGEEKVVDLWCSVSEPKYTGDTLTNVFSSTKSLTAIAMASLVDKGLMNYTDKISSYWPEFGQNGKENITVVDLMRHECGLPVFYPHLLHVEDTLTENIKKNAIGSVIEKLEPNWMEPGRREYHGMTRGWVANELFRRMDPRGRTIGEYLAEDVARPLKADVYIGVPQERFDDFAPVANIGPGKVIKESLKTNTVGGALDIGFSELMTVMNSFRKMMADGRKDWFHPHQDYDQTKFDELFNKDLIRRGETSSANGNCSARGLALVAAAMANKGSIHGSQVLSPEAWDKFHGETVEKPIYTGSHILFQSNFSQGGINKFSEKDGVGRDGYFGWFGYGGSVFQWNPELKIGFAYTPNLLHWFDMTNGRGRLLQQEVVKCIKNKHK